MALRVCQKDQDESVDVLIVEDNIELAEMYALALGASGLVPAIAHTAADAWSLITAAKPRLILLDIELGADNGLDVLERLARQGRGRPATPVLMFTNSDRLQHRRRSEAAGASGYLVKANVRLGALVETIRRELSRSEAATP